MLYYPDEIQKVTRPISSHVDRTSLINKGFIIRPKRYLFLTGRAGKMGLTHWLVRG